MFFSVDGDANALDAGNENADLDASVAAVGLNPKPVDWPSEVDEVDGFREKLPAAGIEKAGGAADGFAACTFGSSFGAGGTGCASASDCSFAFDFSPLIETMCLLYSSVTEESAVERSTNGFFSAASLSASISDLLRPLSEA